MDSSVITKWMVLTTIFSFITRHGTVHSQQVPCAFFFGDSQFDNGNNNALITLAKVNYAPYGIDYPFGATGRFANGKTTADFIAQFVGFTDPIPPFVTAYGPEILRGVNYASGGAGILDETGKIQIGRFTMNQQLLNHKITMSRLTLMLGGSITRANDYLGKCLYTIYVGSNDYINNYLLLVFYLSSSLYTPDGFAEFLIQQYTQQLRTLYSLGARKIAIFGIGPLGCIPEELARYPTNGSSCVDFINRYVQLFNDRLKPLVDNLNSNLVGAQFTYINLTSISLSGNLSTAGIQVANAPCCQVSSLTGLCIPNGVTCSNRNQYVFFDNYHTTEIFNERTAFSAYNATSSTNAYPVGIRRLVQQ